MKTAERVWRIGSDFAGVVPRAHRAVTSSEEWNPLWWWDSQPQRARALCLELTSCAIAAADDIDTTEVFA